MNRHRVMTELLVIGAGPYGLSVAANALDHGIDTIVLGRPMGFWREHMPDNMFLRSGPDWHLDAAGRHTLQAYLDARRIAPAEVDPIPVSLFLAYVEWFRASKRVAARDETIVDLTKPGRLFEAALASGERIAARWVVATPGVRHFASVPDWASRLDPNRARHTGDLVRFGELAGARVLIVGGRQSAYEWAALIAEAAAERVDIVHRHAVPVFDRVSWKFADAHTENTLRTPGWWRRLSPARRAALERQFWEAGRLTLEWWLEPRLKTSCIHRWPGAEVAAVDSGSGANAAITARLSNGERLEVDQVVFATGYKADLGNVPYLHGVLDRVDTANGFPVLDESFRSSLDGLYVPGFAATRDFGPVFGFVKGSPTAATLIVEDLLRRPLPRPLERFERIERAAALAIVEQ